MAIDIIITTRNRLDYLRQTLTHLYMRTRTPYTLHVVDDASEEGNAQWLFEEWRAGRVHDLLLRRTHCGARANQNVGVWMTFSDPFVLCDDDMLCPDVNPGWLACGIREMRQHPELAMLALHHPGAKVKPRGTSGAVTYCLSLGATFLFVRRAFARVHMLPHQLGDFGRPMEPRCQAAHRDGWKIGYLTHIYCYHIGVNSVLDGKPYKGEFIRPIDWDTLRPPDKWAE